MNVTLTGSSGLTVAGTGTLTVNGPSAITGVNAVQTIAFNGGITGGTFALTFNGVTTNAITFTAASAVTTAAAIQAAAYEVGRMHFPDATAKVKTADGRP